MKTNICLTYLTWQRSYKRFNKTKLDPTCCHLSENPFCNHYFYGVFSILSAFILLNARSSKRMIHHLQWYYFEIVFLHIEYKKFLVPTQSWWLCWRWRGWCWLLCWGYWRKRRWSSWCLSSGGCTSRRCTWTQAGWQLRTKQVTPSRMSSCCLGL